MGELTDQKQGDAVNNPPHYQGSGGLDAITVIDAFGLGFTLGNVVKYVLRAAKKNGIEDLKKARWYLDHAIKRAEEGKG